METAPLAQSNSDGYRGPTKRSWRYEQISHLIVRVSLQSLSENNQDACPLNGEGGGEKKQFPHTPLQTRPLYSTRTSISGFKNYDIRGSPWRRTWNKGAKVFAYLLNRLVCIDNLQCADWCGKKEKGGKKKKKKKVDFKHRLEELSPCPALSPSFQFGLSWTLYFTVLVLLPALYDTVFFSLLPRCLGCCRHPILPFHAPEGPCYFIGWFRLAEAHQKELFYTPPPPSNQLTRDSDTLEGKKAPGTQLRRKSPSHPTILL
ncbi:hypothetical protein HOY82DRAFT_125961 [Tuber indicum]|nr:hypothetical protein HOY82DRAFT_125961 [Tuber indicum]